MFGIARLAYADDFCQLHEEAILNIGHHTFVTTLDDAFEYYEAFRRAIATGKTVTWKRTAFSTQPGHWVVETSPMTTKWRSACSPLELPAYIDTLELLFGRDEVFDITYRRRAVLVPGELLSPKTSYRPFQGPFDFLKHLNLVFGDLSAGFNVEDYCNPYGIKRKSKRKKKNEQEKSQG